jgi:hypothetical protein
MCMPLRVDIHVQSDLRRKITYIIPYHRMSIQSSRAIVKEHVASRAHLIMREPEGGLRYPWLCPVRASTFRAPFAYHSHCNPTIPAAPTPKGGFYAQLWDWDAVFCGVGLIPFGGAPYLAGSMKCFFSLTSAEGKVPGCVTPAGASTTLAHAKPVLIWGAYLAADATGDFNQFKEFAPQMRALLAYWHRERLVNGVYGKNTYMHSAIYRP